MVDGIHSSDISIFERLDSLLGDVTNVCCKSEVFADIVAWRLSSIEELNHYISFKELIIKFTVDYVDWKICCGRNLEIVTICYYDNNIEHVSACLLVDGDNIVYKNIYNLVRKELDFYRKHGFIK